MVAFTTPTAERKVNPLSVLERTISVRGRAAISAPAAIATLRFFALVAWRAGCPPPALIGCPYDVISRRFADTWYPGVAAVIGRHAARVDRRDSAPMSSPPPRHFYTGLVAATYRYLRSAAVDPAPYERFVRRVGEPALELGCGDGDPLLDLCASGLDVEGLDASADMLDRCRQAAEQRGLDVTLHLAGMEDMDLGRRYRSIYLAGATFNLLVDDDTAGAALARIAAHLEPGGVALVPLTIPTPTPPTALGEYREHVTDDGATMRFAVIAEERDETTRVQTAQLRYELPTMGSRRVDGANVGPALAHPARLPRPRRRRRALRAGGARPRRPAGRAGGDHVRVPAHAGVTGLHRPARAVPASPAAPIVGAIAHLIPAPGSRGRVRPLQPGSCQRVRADRVLAGRRRW